ncbi:MAG: hypothetical protein TH68_03370 [Candidatus Synechococcus spongiarum 142]|uniref:Uncharacterized protein n=1 Tax=Candidatus Synechococcus spongiarum 142 TaxID=1608213 RepID=A0A6N3X7D9_9SYNE|nr:MAG: hypothetical protein TH68_03370 [Candidatus Synechococcus spongiarum 142]
MGKRKVRDQFHASRDEGHGQKLPESLMLGTHKLKGCSAEEREPQETRVLDKEISGTCPCPGLGLGENLTGRGK